MSLEFKQEVGGKVTEVHVSGKLTKEDYERFVPAVEQRIQQFGKINVLMSMHDFHGWTAGALWEDIKFDLKHFRDIDRLAIVGESKWEKGMSTFCRPFTTAKIRYFDRQDEAAAQAWVEAVETQSPSAS